MSGTTGSEFRGLEYKGYVLIFEEDRRTNTTMKKIIALSALLGSVAFAVACGGSSNANNTANGANRAVANALNSAANAANAAANTAQQAANQAQTAANQMA